MSSESANEDHVVRELRDRGFDVKYVIRGFDVQYIIREDEDGTDGQHPVYVRGEGLNITPDDCRLIFQLPSLKSLSFLGGNISGLNLDEIGNCSELLDFMCWNVTQFPADEIVKLATCPLRVITLQYIADLKDSDLENFAGLTKLETIYLEGNVGITDAGFEYFEKIASLSCLGLSVTSVSKEGVDEFRKKRPDVKVHFEIIPSL